MKWLGRGYFVIGMHCRDAVIDFIQNPRGSLRGVVQDASGGRVSGATIIVTSADFSTERQTKSSDRGEFRVDDLLPGEYRVHVERPFAAAGPRVVVQVSSEVRHRCNAETRRRAPGSKCERGSVVDHDAAGGCSERGTTRYRDGAGLARNPAGASQLCKYCVPGAGNGAGGAVGSYEGAHHRGVDGRQFGVEQRAVGGWRG